MTLQSVLAVFGCIAVVYVFVRGFGLIRLQVLSKTKGVSVKDMDRAKRVQAMSRELEGDWTVGFFDSCLCPKCDEPARMFVFPETLCYSCWDIYMKNSMRQHLKSAREQMENGNVEAEVMQGPGSASSGIVIGNAQS